MTDEQLVRLLCAVRGVERWRGHVRQQRPSKALRAIVLELAGARDDTQDPFTEPWASIEREWSQCAEYEHDVVGWLQRARRMVRLARGEAIEALGDLAEVEPEHDRDPDR